MIVLSVRLEVIGMIEFTLPYIVEQMIVFHRQSEFHVSRCHCYEVNESVLTYQTCCAFRHTEAIQS